MSVGRTGDDGIDGARSVSRVGGDADAAAVDATASDAAGPGFVSTRARSTGLSGSMLEEMLRAKGGLDDDAGAGGGAAGVAGTQGMLGETTTAAPGGVDVMGVPDMDPARLTAADKKALVALNALPPDEIVARLATSLEGNLVDGNAQMRRLAQAARQYLGPNQIEKAIPKAYDRANADMNRNAKLNDIEAQSQARMQEAQRVHHGEGSFDGDPIGFALGGKNPPGATKRPARSAEDMLKEAGKKVLEEGVKEDAKTVAEELGGEAAKGALEDVLPFIEVYKSLLEQLADANDPEAQAAWAKEHLTEYNQSYATTFGIFEKEWQNSGSVDQFLARMQKYLPPEDKATYDALARLCSLADPAQGGSPQKLGGFLDALSKERQSYDGSVSSARRADIIDRIRGTL
jgi:hypothetical protein